MEDMEVERQSIGVRREELVEENEFPARNSTFSPFVFLHRSSSDTYSDSDSDMESSSSDMDTVAMKKRKLDSALPPGFLDPLPPEVRKQHKKMKTTQVDDEASATTQLSHTPVSVVAQRSCRQFWKAGDYEEDNVVCGGDSSMQSSSGSGGGGMDHLRVHPRFLHSNATSHKWALGAIAELLDNSVDEVSNGATFVNVDVILNKKDGTSKMLLVEDDGQGMSPDKLRQCMSLGFSLKSKLANTIGQYGNGFKTSTMRLGADVIVFSKYFDGIRFTKSIGMLSYTFLTTTRKEDIVVPMIDYELRGLGWKRLIRSSLSDWNNNLETILRWSPYRSEEELFEQFNTIKEAGTRIVIYNLWEDDEGKLELDFETDETDIQIRGVNRDDKKIEMAKQCPNSRHFLTYQHSLRSYASILYLRMPPGFRMILRGKDIVHHNLVNDMMLSKEITYRPLAAAGRPRTDPKMVAVGTVGFVKDARSHIDIQGFNVYHKNRLIKPFWRVWNAAGSDGRGVIGVLEADFVEPAHDKQGFERTTALARLESRLVAFQKTYWSANCQHIGYAPRRKGKPISPDGETTPSAAQQETMLPTPGNSNTCRNGESELKSTRTQCKERTSATTPKDTSGNDGTSARTSQNNATPPIQPEIKKECIPNERQEFHGAECSSRKVADESNSDDAEYTQRRNVKSKEEGMDRVRVVGNLLRGIKVKREKCKLLECRLEEAEQKIEEMDTQQETLIDTFSEERTRRDAEGERMKSSLKEATSIILGLLDKVKLLESRQHQVVHLK